MQARLCLLALAAAAAAAGCGDDERAGETPVPGVSVTALEEQVRQAGRGTPGLGPLRSVSCSEHGGRVWLCRLGDRAVTVSVREDGSWSSGPIEVGTPGEFTKGFTLTGCCVRTPSPGR